MRRSALKKLLMGLSLTAILLATTWVGAAKVGQVLSNLTLKDAKDNRTILSDADGTVPAKWGLGDCNDKSVVLVVGKDKELKFIKKGKVRGAEIEKVAKIIEAELAKP